MAMRYQSRGKVGPVHTPRMYRGGVEIQFHSFLNLVLDKGNDQLQAPGRFTPGEKEAGTNSVEGCVVTTATPDVLEKRKISCPAGTQVPDRPVSNLITTTLSRLHKCQRTSFYARQATYV
jgi:hypothetical protein